MSGTTADTELEAVGGVFDRHFVESSDVGAPARYFIRVGIHNGEWGHFRLTLRGGEVLVERCDSRFLVCLPDETLSRKYTELLCHHIERAEGGWTYVGGGVSYADVVIPRRTAEDDAWIEEFLGRVCGAPQQ